jgi:hypothetical protein
MFEMQSSFIGQQLIVFVSFRDRNSPFRFSSPFSLYLAFLMVVVVPLEPQPSKRRGRDSLGCHSMSMSMRWS